MSALSDGHRHDSDSEGAHDRGVEGRAQTHRHRHSRRNTSWAARLNGRLEDFPLEKTTQGLCIAIVVGSLLGIGGVHPSVMLGLGALATALAFCGLALRATDRRMPLAPPVYVLWALAGVCLMQLIPLPLGVLKTLSPTAADIWSRALSPFDAAGPGAAPLSLDPGATRVEALRWFSYGAMFVGAASISSRLGARWATATVFGSACLAALIAVAHGLVGLEKVYGLYTPGFKAEPWHVGPLLNPNNLAGYLNLGALCGLGLLFEDKPLLPRWLNALGVAILVGVTVGAASRGGVVMLIVGVALLVVTLERNRARRAQSRSSARRSRWTLLATVAFGAALAVLSSRARTWHELFDENLDKIAMVRWVRPLIGDFPWFGVGRGAFESVFPAYQSGDGGIVFTHVENFPAQWLVEWGIPIGAVALGALAWALRPGRLGVGTSSPAAGAWCGLMILLAQNLADLGLEIPALCLAFALIFGALWGAAAQRQASLLGPVRHAPSAVRIAAAAALAGALVCASVARGGTSLLDAERQAVHDALDGAKAPRTGAQRLQLRDALRDAMLRHPAEPYFPLVGAALAYQEQDQNPIPWLQRTLERSRANGRAHLLLAQVLHRYRARNQALMELRLAISNEPALIESAARLAVEWAEDEETLVRMVPTGKLEGPTWAALGAFARSPALGRRCDRLALAADDSLVGPMIRLANELIVQRIEGKGCQEDESACAREIERLARSVDQRTPSSSSGGQLRARWLGALGRARDAVALLVELCDSVDDRDSCLHTRTELASAIKEPEPLTQASRALLASACVDERRCADAAEWIGGLHGSRGEWAAAVTHFARAVQHEETDARLLKLAEASGRAGMSGQALRTLERALSRRGGHDPELEARIAGLRKQVVDGALH